MIYSNLAYAYFFDYACLENIHIFNIFRRIHRWQQAMDSSRSLSGLTRTK